MSENRLIKWAKEKLRPAKDVSERKGKIDRAIDADTPPKNPAEEARRDKAADKAYREATTYPESPTKFKKGGSIKSSASRRADGIATKGKTKGRII